MKIKNVSLQLLAAVLLIGSAVPGFARTDGGGKKNSQNQSHSNTYPNPNNANSRGNCYYCWKDLSIDYTPSRHKYAKKL